MAEQHNLIGSDRVEDTRVFDLEGVEIGRIEKLMLEKVSGRVAYAVIKFGDFFGLGGDSYPLPWDKLEYDEELDGYHLGANRDEIEGAPKYPDDGLWGPSYGRSLYGYYGVAPYWGI